AQGRSHRSGVELDDTRANKIADALTADVPTRSAMAGLRGHYRLPSLIPYAPRTGWMSTRSQQELAVRDCRH
ncbi:MAG: hypothetical protein ACRDTF_17145, partial [Pseudonocardiaceae bacterium]